MPFDADWLDARWHRSNQAVSIPKFNSRSKGHKVIDRSTRREQRLVQGATSFRASSPKACCGKGLLFQVVLPSFSDWRQEVLPELPHPETPVKLLCRHRVHPSFPGSMTSTPPAPAGQSSPRTRRTPSRRTDLHFARLSVLIEIRSLELIRLQAFRSGTLVRMLFCMFFLSVSLARVLLSLAYACCRIANICCKILVRVCRCHVW